MLRKVAILTLQDKLETYSDEFRHEFPNTEVIQFGSDYSYDTLKKKAVMIENMGYDVIVCRGYTRWILEPLVSIPLVALEPNIMDVFACLGNYEFEENDKIGVLFNDSNALLQYRGLDKYLERVAKRPVEILFYHDMENYFKEVDQMLARGMVICTGHNGIIRAGEVGGKVSPLFVGHDAIKDCIREAIRITDIRNRDKEYSENLEKLLNNKNEGIIVIDSKLEVTWLNDYAKEALKAGNKNDNFETKISSLLPDVAWNNTFENNYENIITKNIDKEKIILSTRILKHGEEKNVYVFFRYTKNVVEEERKVRADIKKKGQFAKYNIRDVKGNSPAVIDCKNRIIQCAKNDANVLIYGESGTGKELFAQCIHNESDRKTEPFFAINCAALPENLLESELFGYSEGAFTGAKKGGKAGIFELAHKGTVFLDEIGELAPASQSALLRVLQEKEVRRIGDDTIIPIDVRVIAASHDDIYSKVKQNEFRQDLFYRLGTVFVVIPPLRERKPDIMPLIRENIENYQNENGVIFTGSFQDSAVKALEEYSWEGNVRELQNFVKRIFALEYYRKDMNEEDIGFLLMNSPAPIQNTSSLIYFDKHEETESKMKHSKITKEDIIEALEITKGNKTSASEELGISRTHLWRLMREYNIIE